MQYVADQASESHTIIIKMLKLRSVCASHGIFKASPVVVVF